MHLGEFIVVRDKSLAEALSVEGGIYVSDKSLKGKVLMMHGVYYICPHGIGCSSNLALQCPKCQVVSDNLCIRLHDTILDAEFDRQAKVGFRFTPGVSVRKGA